MSRLLMHDKEKIQSMLEEIEEMQNKLNNNESTNVKNCILDTTPYDLQNHQINNPDMYRRANLNDLKVNTKYRYCFTLGTYPERVKVLTNEEDTLVITNPFGEKPWTFTKSEELNPNKNIFYEKV